MMTRKLFLTVVLVSMVLSGCAAFNGRAVIMGGPDDLLTLPKGTVIQGVKLPTADGQPHDVITPRGGFWVSARGWNRIENDLGGSAPADEKGEK